VDWHGSLLEEGQDGSGYQYKRNRYYDPKTGRFNSEDPIGLAGGINLYAYAGNNPVMFADPFGLDPCLVKGNCTQVQEGKVGAHNSRKIARLRPDVQDKARTAMALAGTMYRTLYIAESYRTEERQNELYAQGRNGDTGKIVTNCSGAQCPHVEGRAMDVYPVAQGGTPIVKDATPQDMDVVGAVGEAAGFEWGGGWRQPDRPHLEVP